jgi:nitrogen fixation/metabolism regulation signal transduction histidine kinase
MLRPILALTKATSEIKNGNLYVSIKQRGNDELSALSESFNLMICSTKLYIKKHNELTKQLEVQDNIYLISFSAISSNLLHLDARS